MSSSGLFRAHKDILPLIISDYLDRHQFHGLVILAFQNMPWKPFSKDRQDLIAERQMVIDDLWQ